MLNPEENCVHACTCMQDQYDERVSINMLWELESTCIFFADSFTYVYLIPVRPKVNRGTYV